LCWRHQVTPTAIQMLSMQNQLQTDQCDTYRRPYLVMWLSVALFILLMEDEKLFTLQGHSSSGCSREHVCAHFDYTGSQSNKLRQWCIIVNILRITVGNLNATMNRDSWQQESEISTYGSSQTWQNPWVER
jgi:hypothetical protein